VFFGNAKIPKASRNLRFNRIISGDFGDDAPLIPLCFASAIALDNVLILLELSVGMYYAISLIILF